MGLPILVGAFVEFRDFSEAEAGYLASGDLGGMFVSSLLVSIYIRRINRRLCIVAGIAIALAADILAIYAGDFTAMLGVRISAGIGAGLCYSLALTNLARSTHNARNFSFLIFALVFVNFLELYSLEVISDHWGVAGIFITFAIINVLCLAATPFLPAGDIPDPQPSTSPIAHSSKELARLCVLCLVAIACFYLMVGAFWAYIERMGVHAGFDDDFIAAALSITTLLSLLGCYVAYRLSRTLGQSRPLITAAVILAGVLFWLGLHPVAFTFVAVLMLYQLLWNGIDIFQLGTLSNIDRSGRYVALVPAAQGIGQTIGPSIAAYLVGAGFGYGAVMNVGAAAALATALIYGRVYVKLRSRKTEH